MILGPSGPKSNSKGGRLMKNFRKVLALILVVATLFSFVAMVSAKDADDYSDYDKVSYAEAVDVLSAIGILDGYPDGTFRPANTIKRSEMAKMIAVLSNAGDDVSDLYASACTFADAKNDWAASYIAYCAQTGIVAGRNATTFDPNGKVTGIETAKMLLCVLGFDAATQGYVGTNWKTNILRDAKDHGLLNGFAADYDPDKAITREEAAQMMLNALQANIVIGTISENLVKITNTLYFDRFGGHVSIPDAENEGWIVITRQNVVISPFPLGTIYKGLTLTADLDCYGNPGFSWVYRNAKGTVVFEKFYATAADYSYTNRAALASDLDEEINGKAYEYALFVDGTYVAAPTGTTGTQLTSANMRAVANNYTGKGVETHVYVDDTNAIVIITVKNTYIGRVARTSNMETKFVLESPSFTGVGPAFDNTDYGFEAGDIILYWVCSSNTDFTVNATGAVTFSGTTNRLHDAKVVEPVTGAATYVTYDRNVATNTASATVTVEGKTYEYAENFGLFFVVDGNTTEMRVAEVDASKNNGVTYDLYLDEFGYIMGWRETPDDTTYQYGYFIEGSNAASNAGLDSDGTQTYTYTADYVDMAGELHSDVEINAATFTAMTTYTTRGGSRTDDCGMLASFVVNNDVIGISDDPATSTWMANGAIASTSGVEYYLSSDGKIMQDVRRDGDDSNDTVYMAGSGKTQYLVRTWDYEKEEYVYTAYTNKTLPGDLFNNVLRRDGVQTYKMQYFWETVNGGRLLTHVFIDAIYSGVAQRAFVLNYVETRSGDKFVNQIGRYDAYDAIINGEPAILALALDFTWPTVAGVTGVPGSAINRNNIFYLVEARMQVIGLDDSGVPVYALSEEVTPTVTFGQQIFYYNGSLVYSEPVQGSTVDTITPADDCLLVIGDITKNSNGTYSKSAVVADSIADLENYLPDGPLVGLPGTPAANVDYYILENAWVVVEGGVAIEVYVDLNSATTGDFDAPQH